MEQVEPQDNGELTRKIQRNFDLAERDNCQNKHTKRVLQCRCLGVLDGREEFCQAVAEYQVMFQELGYVEQKKIVLEWMRSNSNEGTRKFYRIPFILEPSDDASLYTELKNTTICANAMMDLFDRGYKWWKSCLHHYNNTTLPSHKLKG